MKRLLLLILLCLSLTACSQQQNSSPKSKKTIEQNYKNKQIMDLSKITNPTVRQAMEALQNGDKSWYSNFTENPVMTDDGNTVDFKNFFSKALENEKFLTIDKVENDGKDIYGNFKAGNWGTFRVFFKFYQNTDGKFDRLDIGQGN